MNELELGMLELAKKRKDAIRNDWLFTFASQAMQGAIAGCLANSRGRINDDTLIRESINMAKALLAELEEETK